MSRKPDGRRLPATAQHEAFYREATRAIAQLARRYPAVRTIEIIAVLGRAAGYAVAMCHPHERDLARETALRNLDLAVADLVAAMPPAPDGPAGTA